MRFSFQQLMLRVHQSRKGHFNTVHEAGSRFKPMPSAPEFPSGLPSEHYYTVIEQELVGQIAGFFKHHNPFLLAFVKSF